MLSPKRDEFTAATVQPRSDASSSARPQVFEHFVKMQMNPFYKEDMQITSKPFDKAVHAAARRYL